VERKRRKEKPANAGADEIRHLLDEGVVTAAAILDACLILGAGYRSRSPEGRNRRSGL